VFVEFLSEFLYLFLCLLMFFIFAVLKFLSASCTFWLTISHIFSMNFSVTSSKNSSLRVFMWVLLGSLVVLVYNSLFYASPFVQGRRFNLFWSWARLCSRVLMWCSCVVCVAHLLGLQIYEGIFELAGGEKWCAAFLQADTYWDWTGFSLSAHR
jgi:hypothetical protein